MFLLRVRYASHAVFKKKILPVLDATVIVLCHTLTFGLKRGFFLVFCPCPSLKHWALFACLLRLCKQASIGTQFTSGSVFLGSVFFLDHTHILHLLSSFIPVRKPIRNFKHLSQLDGCKDCVFFVVVKLRFVSVVVT